MLMKLHTVSPSEDMTGISADLKKKKRFGFMLTLLNVRLSCSEQRPSVVLSP